MLHTHSGGVDRGIAFGLAQTMVQVSQDVADLPLLFDLGVVFKKRFVVGSHSTLSSSMCILRAIIRFHAIIVVRGIDPVLRVDLQGGVLAIHTALTPIHFQAAILLMHRFPVAPLLVVGVKGVAQTLLSPFLVVLIIVMPP